MTIQWFPGHMTKARRKLQENLPKIDVVLEVLDARVPLASRNPMLDEIVGDKPRLVLVNKMDLADSRRTDQWLSFFRREPGTWAVSIDARSDKSVKGIVGNALKLVRAKREEAGRRPLSRRCRAMVIGIPNSGKSTLINHLAGRKVARTGNEPAVTRREQWVKVDKDFELLDTPGILWHKFEDQRTGYYLAATGAIKDAILDLSEVARFACGILQEHYADNLKARFKLSELSDAPLDTLTEIGRMRGCLAPGGVIDIEKACELFLRDYRGGKLGRITLQLPEDA